MEKKFALDRRSFLKGAAITGVGAAVVGLTGCSNSDGGSSNGSSGSGSGTNSVPSSISEGELLYTASINPQDYEYRDNTTDFSTLFSPVKIGPIELSHRMVKSAAGSATFLNGLTDEFSEYYINLAKGGVELIWVEGDMVALITGENENAESMAFGKSLVEECAKYGASLGLQWAQFAAPVADLSKEDIAGIQAIGVNVATIIKEMGFKAIEINAAGFNQGEYFLSRYHNDRDDEYGAGSLENRARFVTEWIGQVKEACGDDFAVQVLFDCIEEQDNLDNNATLMNLDNTLTGPRNLVITAEEGIEFAKMFEAAGADSLHLRLGPLGNHPCQFGSDLYFILNGIEGATGYGTQWNFDRHWQGQLDGTHSGAGMLLDLVARYKAAVNIPCGTVTYMDPAHAPDFFEQALADGKCDFYLMTRPLTVDMDYVNKLREGRIEEIAPCTRCLHCHIGSNELNRMMGYCRVNALTQRVMTENGPATYELEPATSPKKVMVVGGGPAGMEAARIAAARGHEVTLYEKNGSLGGLLDFAHVVKGPHENLIDLKNYLTKQQEINGVTVVLDQEVNADFINSEAPDAVILAVGGVAGELEVSGTEVLSFDQFMSDQVGENVVVYGANAQAFDAALWLTVHKKNVTMVTSTPNDLLDQQQSQHAMRFMTTALYSLGVKVWPAATITGYADGQITVSTDAETETTFACDTIINAADLVPNTSILDGVTVTETYSIGDCDEPFNMAYAIRAGNDIGRAI